MGFNRFVLRSTGQFVMNMNTQAYCAFGGLSAFFALEYTGVLATPPFTSDEVPLLSTLSCNILGVVCGALTLQYAKGRPYLWQRLWQPQWPLALIVVLLTLLGGALRLGVALEVLPLWNNGIGSFLSGLFFPMLLRWLMHTAKYPGFMLAGALSLSELTRIYTLFVPQPVDTCLVMYLNAGYQCAVGLFSLLCLLHDNKEQPAPPSSTEEKMVFSKFEIVHFIILGLCFFPLSFLLDILFYREQLLLIPQMTNLHIFIGVCYLLCGIMFDNSRFNKHDILLTIMLVLFASVLFVADTGPNATLLYCLSYAIELTARCCAFISFTLLVQRQEFTNLYPKVDPSYVYVVKSLIIILICTLFPILHSTDLLFISGIVIPLFLMYVVYFVYKMILKIKNQNTKYSKRGTIVEFASQYDLSPREIEVLQYLVVGCETETICEELHVSKNTVKTHIRQILRKVNSKNRNELLVVYFDFCLKSPADEPLEISTP